MNVATPPRPESPFWFYASMFDVEGTITRQSVPSEPDSRYLTNFLGVRIDPKFFPSILDDRAGQVEGIPIPANWHADMAEWAYAIRSVERCSGPFTMVELGCGWGCWMNNTGLVAKRLGLEVNLIGIEADQGHIQFARESLETNGFTEGEITLLRGIAAAQSGIALFPRQDHAGGHWGLAPILGATEGIRQEAMATGQYEELPMVALTDAVGDHRVLDLLHLDIQGGEADLVEGCISFLNDRCAAMLIGTHSRELEGRLSAFLLADGWKLDIERAAIVKLTEDGPVTIVDGVQGWRNPRITATA